MSQRTTAAAGCIELVSDAQQISAASEAKSTAPTVHRLWRRALLLGSANAFDYALQFLLPLVLVRCLDTAAFGQYRLLWLVVGTVLGLATLAMPPSLYYYLPRSDRATKRLYVNQTLLFLVLSGLIAAWIVRGVVRQGFPNQGSRGRGLRFQLRPEQLSAPRGLPAEQGVHEALLRARR